MSHYPHNVNSVIQYGGTRFLFVKLVRVACVSFDAL